MHQGLRGYRVVRTRPRHDLLILFRSRFKIAARDLFLHGAPQLHIQRLRRRRDEQRQHNTCDSQSFHIPLLQAFWRANVSMKRSLCANPVRFSAIEPVPHAPHAHQEFRLLRRWLYLSPQVHNVRVHRAIGDMGIAIPGRVQGADRGSTRVPAAG